MQTWNVEASYRVRAPQFVKAKTVSALRTKLQRLADTYRPNEDNPPLGKLSFRYELDEQSDEAVVVHAYYQNKYGKRARFMRLRRLVV